MTAFSSVYFYNPRFSMTLPGRLLVRVVSVAVYIIGVVAGITFVVSSLPAIQALGALILLFFADRIFHINEGDARISELNAQGEVNAAQAMRPRALRVLERAYDHSRVSQSDLPLEFLLELLHISDIQEAITRLEINLDEFRSAAEEMLTETRADPLEEAGHIAEAALREAVNTKHVFIDISDCFSALAGLERESIQRLMARFSLEAKDVRLAMLFVSERRHLRNATLLAHITPEAHRTMRHRVMNRAWTAKPTPALDAVSRDLTDIARSGSGGFMIGHAGEYERLVETLSRAAHPNVLLVGPQGIGKETLIAHLAHNLTKDTVPGTLFDKRLVELDLTALVSGAASEELQKRLRQIISEIESAGNIILFIPDIHNLLKTSGTAYLSAADALIPIIMSDAFPIIGSTYPREFTNSIEQRSDFASLFDVIRVQEISTEEAEQLLAYEGILLEKEHGITVTLGALRSATRIAQKYFHEFPLPGSASELLKSAVSRALGHEDKLVSQEDVVVVAEEKTNVPIHEAQKDEAETLLHLEDVIHQHFIDQEEAVKVVARALREYRSGLARPGGPIASFLFVGPTGVGKTELAKTLARVQFGSESAMIRFDMTEYQERGSISRLIGSPDGTMAGTLTEAVKTKPYSLILLDEFEKAEHDILNLFLQVLDDGRLTSSNGETVDFQNTIIIATSNAHSDIIVRAIEEGKTVADIAEDFKKKLIDIFVPELINRFTAVVMFKSLSPDDLKAVAVLNLKSLSKTLEAQGIALTWDDAAITLLARLGYEPAFGARPLRRVIEEKIRSVLAEKILRKEVSRGSKLVLSAKEDTFIM